MLWGACRILVPLRYWTNIADLDIIFSGEDTSSTETNYWIHILWEVCCSVFVGPPCMHTLTHPVCERLIHLCTDPFVLGSCTQLSCLTGNRCIMEPGLGGTTIEPGLGDTIRCWGALPAPALWGTGVLFATTTVGLDRWVLDWGDVLACTAAMVFAFRRGTNLKVKWKLTAK